MTAPYIGIVLDRVTLDGTDYRSSTQWFGCCGMTNRSRTLCNDAVISSVVNWKGCGRNWSGVILCSVSGIFWRDGDGDEGGGDRNDRRWTECKFGASRLDCSS